MVKGVSAFRCVIINGNMVMVGVDDSSLQAKLQPKSWSEGQHLLSTFIVAQRYCTFVGFFQCRKVIA